MISCGESGMHAYSSLVVACTQAHSPLLYPNQEVHLALSSPHGRPSASTGGLRHSSQEVSLEHLGLMAEVEYDMHWSLHWWFSLLEALDFAVLVAVFRINLG